MLEFRKKRIFFFCASILLMVLVFLFLFWQERQCCLGVKILSAKQAEQYSEYHYADLSDILTFWDEPAAIDIETSTIYISQDITQGSTYLDMKGSLKAQSASYELFFINDPLLTDMATAVKEAHPFALIAADSTGRFMKYNVVFTSLPLVRIDGTFSHQDSSSRDVLAGTFRLWDPSDPETESYHVSCSHLWWHIRGRTTSHLPKKPWKLRLMNDDGTNNDLPLLGLGADDDWLLNALSLDDTKFREKMFMDLWNEMAAEAPYNFKMSTGEYVDVVANGKYYGVYLLQRRIDRKYLDLTEEDALFKAVNYVGEKPNHCFRATYYAGTPSGPYHLLDGIFYGTDYSSIDMQNIIDVNLYLQLFAALDNKGTLNVYLAFQKTDTGYQCTYIPWDTDMSMGIIVGSPWYCDYEKMVPEITIRQETEGCLALYPEMELHTSARWQQLRNSLFSLDNLLSRIDEYESVLVNSGAYARDQQLWGLYYHGADSPDGVRGFIEDRLDFLDELYQ